MYKKNTIYLYENFLVKTANIDAKMAVIGGQTIVERLSNGKKYVVNVSDLKERKSGRKNEIKSSKKS